MNTTDYTTEMALLEIPSEYAALDFKMDPKTEDLLWGHQLEVGMIVLFEETTLRENPMNLERLLQREMPASDLEYEMGYLKRRLDEKSRWCRVVDIRGGDEYSELINFIGLYADGSKMSRTYNKAYAWFVKTSV